MLFLIKFHNSIITGFLINIFNVKYAIPPTIIDNKSSMLLFKKINRIKQIIPTIPIDETTIELITFLLILISTNLKANINVNKVTTDSLITDDTAAPFCAKYGIKIEFNMILIIAPQMVHFNSFFLHHTLTKLVFQINY